LKSGGEIRRDGSVASEGLHQIPERIHDGAGMIAAGPDDIFWRSTGIRSMRTELI
jgi:hypothetical protein